MLRYGVGSGAKVLGAERGHAPFLFSSRRTVQKFGPAVDTVDVLHIVKTATAAEELGIVEIAFRGRLDRYSIHAGVYKQPAKNKRPTKAY